MAKNTRTNYFYFNYEHIHPPTPPLTKSTPPLRSNPGTATEKYVNYQILQHFAEITKKHWIRNDLRPNCMNKSCSKQFTKVLDRQHHCRHCGEIFCSDCLGFKLPLNLQAQYDDLMGKKYKVNKMHC